MRRSRTHQGFTLIELMITLALVAIALTLALPSFEDSFRRNRVASATNELMASFALARTEAVRRNYSVTDDRNVVLCPSADGAACGGAWSDGWIVAQRTGATIDQVLRYVQGPSGVTVTSAMKTESFTNAAYVLQFDNRGRLEAGSNFSLQPEQCPAGQDVVRNLIINSVGQIRVARASCT